MMERILFIKVINKLYKYYCKNIYSMAKCEICGNKIRELFLEKIDGTIIKDEKGKKHFICSECQKKYPDKKAILEKI